MMLYLKTKLCTDLLDNDVAISIELVLHVISDTVFPSLVKKVLALLHC